MLIEKQHLLEAQIDELRKTISAQDQYLAVLHAQIDELRSARELTPYGLVVSGGNASAVAVAETPAMKASMSTP